MEFILTQQAIARLAIFGIKLYQKLVSVKVLLAQTKILLAILRILLVQLITTL